MESNKSERPFIVGMIGHAKAGKDTCASFLQSELCNQNLVNHQFTVSLAYGLKSMAMSLGFTVDEVYRPECKEVFNETFGMTPRKAMQTIGTMFRENFGKDIWLKYLENYVCTQHRKDSIVFVPDIRFPNEANYIRDRFDCFLIKVERPSLDLSLPMYQHESEIYVDSIQNFDVIVINDSDLESFKIKSLEYMPLIVNAFKNHLQPNKG